MPAPPPWMNKESDSVKARKQAAQEAYMKKREAARENPAGAATFDESEGWVVEAMDWVRAVTKHPISNGLNDLRDGKILCQLINCIRPGTISLINKCSAANKHQGLICMENIRFFIDGCVTIGVSNNDLFQPEDLFAGMNKRQAIICIAALGRCTFNVAEYKGPKLGHCSTTYEATHEVDVESAEAVQTRLDELAKAKGVAVQKAEEHKARRAADTYKGTQLEMVRAWTEDVVGEQWSSDDMWEALHNGIFLCKLAEKILPGHINLKKLHRSKIAFMCMENIGEFCKQCKAMGVRPSDQFRPPDLYEKKGYPKQILQCIERLGHTCAKVKGYTGPTMVR